MDTSHAVWLAVKYIADWFDHAPSRLARDFPDSLRGVDWRQVERDLVQRGGPPLSLVADEAISFEVNGPARIQVAAEGVRDASRRRYNLQFKVIVDMKPKDE